jgi:hypothetical protein
MAKHVKMKVPINTDHRANTKETGGLAFLVWPHEG